MAGHPALWSPSRCLEAGAAALGPWSLTVAGVSPSCTAPCPPSPGGAAPGQGTGLQRPGTTTQLRLQLASTGQAVWGHRVPRVKPLKCLWRRGAFLLPLRTLEWGLSTRKRRHPKKPSRSSSRRAPNACSHCTRGQPRSHAPAFSSLYFETGSHRLALGLPRLLRLAQNV